MLRERSRRIVLPLCYLCVASSAGKPYHANAMKHSQLTVHQTGAAAGPAVVFLHGFPFTRALWRTQHDALNDGFRCVSYDLRGFGENPSADGITTIETHVDDLLEIVAQVLKAGKKARGKDARVVLCGHSLGAHVALRAIERAPEQIAAVAICGAHAKAPSDRERLAAAAHIRAIDQSGMRRFLERYLNDCFAADSRDTPGGSYDEALDAGESMSPAALKGALLAMAARTATLPFLEEKTPPLLIISGAEDTMVPPEALMRMGLGIAGAQFVRVPHAAHAAPLDNPEFVTNALRRFFSGEAVQAALGA